MLKRLRSAQNNISGKFGNLRSKVKKAVKSNGLTPTDTATNAQTSPTDTTGNAQTSSWAKVKKAVKSNGLTPTDTATNAQTSPTDTTGNAQTSSWAKVKKAVKSYGLTPTDTATNAQTSPTDTATSGDAIQTTTDGQPAKSENSIFNSVKSGLRSMGNNVLKAPTRIGKTLTGPPDTSNVEIPNLMNGDVSNVPSAQGIAATPPPPTNNRFSFLSRKPSIPENVQTQSQTNPFSRDSKIIQPNSTPTVRYYNDALDTFTYIIVILIVSFFIYIILKDLYKSLKIHYMHASIPKTKKNMFSNQASHDDDNVFRSNDYRNTNWTNSIKYMMDEKNKILEDEFDIIRKFKKINNLPSELNTSIGIANIKDADDDYEYTKKNGTSFAETLFQKPKHHQYINNTDYRYM
jgi:hypothetical protein